MGTRVFRYSFPIERTFSGLGSACPMVDATHECIFPVLLAVNMRETNTRGTFFSLVFLKMNVTFTKLMIVLNG